MHLSVLLLVLFTSASLIFRDFIYRSAQGTRGKEIIYIFGIIERIYLNKWCLVYLDFFVRMSVDADLWINEFYLPLFSVFGIAFQQNNSEICDKNIHSGDSSQPAHCNVHSFVGI